MVYPNWDIVKENPRVTTGIYQRYTEQPDPDTQIIHDSETIRAHSQITSHFWGEGGLRICDSPNTRNFFLWKICDTGGWKWVRKSQLLA